MPVAATSAGSGVKGSGGVPPRGLLAANRARRPREGDGGWFMATPLSAAFVGLLVAEARPVAGELIGRHGSGVADLSARSSQSGALGGAAGAPTLYGGTGSDMLADPRQLSLFVDSQGGHGGGHASLALPDAGIAGYTPGEGVAAAAPAGGPHGSIQFTLGGGAGAALDAPYPEDAPGYGDGGNLPPIGHVVRGGDGNDHIVGTDDADNLAGGAGDDVIEGRGGNDTIDGQAGNDTIDGGAGDDAIDGGAGDDTVDGGSGNDDIDGGSGNDDLNGGSGNDDLDGGDGNDDVDGGTGIDTGTGGTGNDIIRIDHIHDLALENREGFDGGGNDTVVINAGYAASLAAALPQLSPEGRATFITGADLSVGAPPQAEDYVQRVHPDIENVRLDGDVAHDIVGDARAQMLMGNAADNLIWGEGGNDDLYGRGGDDGMWGGSGDDRLQGGAGDDSLWGDSGADTLHGGVGDDMLYGGGGDDTYVVGLHDSGRDTIFDHAGSNGIAIEDVTADRITMALNGDDLSIRIDGVERVVVDRYVGHEGSFSGLQLDEGAKAFDAFLPGGGPAPQAADLLSSFMPQPQTHSTPDLLIGFSGGELTTSEAEPEPTNLTRLPVAEHEAVIHEPMAHALQDVGRDIWVAVDTTSFDTPTWQHDHGSTAAAPDARELRPEDLVD